MTAFQCLPIESAVAGQFRAGLDQNGNAVRRVVATQAGGFPCRHCLDLASAGQTVLLGSYNVPRPHGIYRSASPIFVHAEPCSRFVPTDELAPIVRANSLVSIRAYDMADQCIYELGQVCGGGDAEKPLRRALADERTSFVNIHTARPGCLLCRVERVT